MPRYLVEIIACGVSRLNAKRQRLKELSAEIDERFRQCNLVTYRQIALEKGSVWDLIAERNLPEMMSAWTLSPAIAKTFKGGVPPEGWQGVIVALKPPAGSIILNLDTLYRSDDFLIALDRERGFITGCADGAGRYGGVLSAAQRHTHFLDSPRMTAVLGRSDFRFADLKHRNVSVFNTIRGCIGDR